MRSSVVLPQPFGAHDAEPLAARQVEAQVLEQELVAVALGQVFGVEHVVAGAGHLAERDVRAAHLRRLFAPVDLVERLHPRLRLLGELPVVRPADVLLLLLDVLLLRSNSFSSRSYFSSRSRTYCLKLPGKLVIFRCAARTSCS